MIKGETKKAKLDSEGILRIEGRICVPKVDDLIMLILEEAHYARYFIYLGIVKIIMI